MPFRLRFSKQRKPSPITGSSGAWVNLTPAGMSLAVDVTGSTAWSGFSGTDSFGVSGMCADPSRAGTVFCAAAYQGVWKSTDYGLSWNRCNTGSTVLNGTSWSISVGANYMLANNGYGSEGGIYRSQDQGVSWSLRRSGDINVVKINPFNESWSIGLPHGPDSNASYWVSSNAGEAYQDAGSSPAGIYGDGDWIASTVFLVCSPAGVYLGKMASATSWTWSSVLGLTGPHGGFQMYHDRARGAIYLGGQDGATSRGRIYRSDDVGETWTMVCDLAGVSYGPATVFGTTDRLYAQGSYATHDPYGPISHGAPSSAGSTGWANTTMSTGMGNGAHSAAALTDGERWKVLTANVNYGIWGYIE